MPYSIFCATKLIISDDAGAEPAREAAGLPAGPALIVAIGGGSPIDVAKALGLLPAVLAFNAEAMPEARWPSNTEQRLNHKDSKTLRF